VSQFLDGELDATTGESIEQHLEVCESCAQFADFARGLQFSLWIEPMLDPPPSPSVPTLLRKAPPERARPRPGKGRLAVLAVCLALLVGGIGVARDEGYRSMPATAALSLPPVLASRTLDPDYIPYLRRSYPLGVPERDVAGTFAEKSLFFETPMTPWDEYHYRPERL